MQDHTADPEDHAAVRRLADLVPYQEKAVVSRQILKGKTGSGTLFAFDAGEGLSEHTAPFEALVQGIEGRATIRIAGTAHEVAAGDVLTLPAGKPHAVRAPGRFKMLLVMIRE